MKKGSGIISPSYYGYQLGMRVVSVVPGSSSNSLLKDGKHMELGIEGIITGIEGSYTEILGDDGLFYVRWESKAGNNLKIVNREPQYEIY